MVFLTLHELAKINFKSPDFRFPQEDDAFYTSILTTIFWEKNYENLTFLLQAVFPSTTDRYSDHIFVCGIQSLVSILPKHLALYDIKHIISGVRKLLLPPLQRIFDGHCTTITTLPYLLPGLLRSLTDHAKLNHSPSQTHTQSFSDRFDRSYQSDRHTPRDSRDPRTADNLPKLPDANRTHEKHRLNNIAPATHRNTVTLEPPDTTFLVSVGENCGVRNDHDTYECLLSCQALECSCKFVLPHAHCDCP